MRRFARSYLIAGIAFYVATFHVAYAWVIQPAFAYRGYAYEPESAAALVACWMLAVVPALWMPINVTRPSQFVLWFLYLIVVVPGCLMPTYLQVDGAGGALALSSTLVAMLLLLVATYYLPKLRLPSIRISGTQFWVAVGALSAVFLTLIVRRFGLSVQAVSLAEAYDARGDYKEALAEGGRWIAYAIGWQSKVLNPLLVAVGIVNKNVIALGAGLASQLLIFFITGFRSVLFSSLLVAILLLISQWRGRWVGVYMAWGGGALIVSALALDRLLGIGTASSLFVRRLLVVPGTLTGYYYEYFSHHPNLLAYDYEVGPAKLIASLHGGGDSSSMNANLWAYGFAYYDFVGVLVVTIGLAALFWIADSVAMNRDYQLSCIIFAVPALSLTNTAFQTALVSHGILLSILLIAIMPRSAGSRLRNQVPAEMEVDSRLVHKDELQRCL